MTERKQIENSQPGRAVSAEAGNGEACAVANAARRESVPRSGEWSNTCSEPAVRRTRTQPGAKAQRETSDQRPASCPGCADYLSADPEARRKRGNRKQGRTAARAQQDGPSELREKSPWNVAAVRDAAKSTEEGGPRKRLESEIANPYATRASSRGSAVLAETPQGVSRKYHQRTDRQPVREMAKQGGARLQPRTAPYRVLAERMRFGVFFSTSSNKEAENGR